VLILEISDEMIDSLLDRVLPILVSRSAYSLPSSFGIVLHEALLTGEFKSTNVVDIKTIKYLKEMNDLKAGIAIISLCRKNRDQKMSISPSQFL
jgi:hypothetical protein